MKALSWLPPAVGVAVYLGVAPLRCSEAEGGCSGWVAWDGNTHLNAALFGASVGIAVWLVILCASNWQKIGPVGRVMARTVLLCATLVCLASLGGAMAGAFPILVPLIVLVLRTSHSVTAVLWGVLGFLAVFEAGFMYVYIFPRGLPLVGALFIVGAGAIALLLGMTHALRRHRMHSAFPGPGDSITSSGP